MPNFYIADSEQELNEHNDQLAQIEQNEIENQWLSVNDEMPNNEDQVRTLDNIGREFDCTFYFHENRGNRPYFHVNGYVWEHDNVTHWRKIIT